MPRAPVAGREIRRRSRNGCWNCKARKVKCGEEKPRCSNCERLDEDCDYKIRLSWGGRPLKKKQLENGTNGQDPNPDDQSQFIPGAGQFSINQHFPSPQTFVQTTHNNGTTRKPPVPRVGNGKKTTMSNYQTVFSVAEPQTPTHNQQVMQATVQAPLDPQLRVSNGRPPPLQQPLQQPQTPIMHQRNGSGHPYDWEQGLTPTTATPHSTTYDSEVIYKTEHHQQALYSPYTPVSTSFVPQVTSPVSSHGNGYVHSPPGSVTSPTGHYSQPHNSPPLQHQQKAYHAPPPILTSPTKRLRTSTSPTQPPPNSPYIYGMNGHTVSMPPHTTSIGTALDYMPTSSAQMAHMEMMDHTAVTGVGTNTIMRRVSVENLLAAPLPNSDTSYGGGSFVDRFPSELDDYKREELQKGMNFGVDNGDPDLDQDSDVEEIPRHNFDGYGGQGLSRYNHQSSRMYPSGSRGVYSINPNSPFYPVQITIPRRLDPLPQLLLANKKNMMYFHHYLHYTARLLVPHDCSENPFKSILPQMAVQTDHLMNLLLAYSASHRARLLEHKEPTERIGRFLDETVRSLQASLDDPVTAKSDSTLATAIMLSSYQIISPNPFNMAGLNITWQTHLSAARKIILARGGAQGMHSRDKVSYFLVRWFAYLDLLGSLSGREIDEPFFSGKYWTNDDGNDEQEEFSVDCFFGFTGRCVSILAKIGELARQCETDKREFLEASSMSSGPMILSSSRLDSWHPSPKIQAAAMALQRELEDARGKASGHCSHTHHQEQHFRTGSPADESDAVELLATNDAFHWAALVHLYRRVLNYHTHHLRVQNAVAQIVSAMLKVPLGGTAENCLLFPLFSAGCEAVELEHREYTLKRMLAVEKSGLTQVRHARLLMQRVWSENRPWWEMADGEFIG